MRIVGTVSPGIGIWQVTVPSEPSLIVSPTAFPKVLFPAVTEDPARYSLHSCNLILGFNFVEDPLEMLTTMATLSPENRMMPSKKYKMQDGHAGTSD